MLLLFAIACAPNVATLGICSPVGSFLLPQPDHVVMDAEHNIEVAVACAESRLWPQTGPERTGWPRAS